MEVAIKGDAKEIAALVLEIQRQQKQEDSVHDGEASDGDKACSASCKANAAQ